jgi:hypothetical protein
MAVRARSFRTEVPQDDAGAVYSSELTHYRELGVMQVLENHPTGFIPTPDQPAKQQIPRAKMPRFGMTILWDVKASLVSRRLKT